MLHLSRRHALRGQSRQEVVLIVAVVVVALSAALSVFIPALRAFWLSLGRALLG
jgi:Flp pilus assembly pilin Flp